MVSLTPPEVSTSMNTNYLLKHSAYASADAERRKRLISREKLAQLKRERAIRWMLKAAQLDQAQRAKAQQREEESRSANYNSATNTSDQQRFPSSSSSIPSSYANNNSSNSRSTTAGGEGNELDDLINWADELDFSSYLTEWTRLATSETSDAALIRKDEMKKLKEDLEQQIDEQEREILRQQKQAFLPFPSSDSDTNSIDTFSKSSSFESIQIKRDNAAFNEPNDNQSIFSRNSDFHLSLSQNNENT